MDIKMQNNNGKREVEAIRVSKSDLGLEPERFAGNTDAKRMGKGWNWAFYQENEKEPPIHYLREFTPDGFTPKTGFGIIRLGESVLQDKTGLDHYFHMHQGGNALYTLDEGEYDYMQRSDDGLAEFHYSEHTAHIREADILDLHYEYFPYAMLVNENGPLGAGYIHQHALVTGMYEGKKVRMLGGWDRVFGSFKFCEEGVLFAGMTFAGIKEDGCREWGFVAKAGRRGIGFFCRDGEEPVTSTAVTMEADWKEVPYIKEGRKVYIYDEAVFSFEGIEIHYHARWGFVGQDFETHKESSLSDSSGEWYEGKTPYGFKDRFVFAECWSAHRECLEEAGFQI